MTGRIITFDHQTYDLPELLEWDIVCTGSVPCDSFSVTCPYTADMAGILHRAVSLLALNGSELVLRGIVDEYTVNWSSAGAAAVLTGRGLAARLLDNESRPLTYQAAALRDILRNHVTPYGISCARCAEVKAGSVYTVASGTSQWKALEEFCRTYGGFTPTFRRDGVLLAAPAADASTFALDENTALLQLTKRENHYGVLSEVLVIDKTRNVSYSVKNADFMGRGGQRRQVIYTPGQSTWAAMRYTGQYQIDCSAEDEITLHATLAGTASVSPGDTVRLSLPNCGLSGTYTVTQTEQSCSETGEITELTMKERS